MATKKQKAISKMNIQDLLTSGQHMSVMTDVRKSIFQKMDPKSMGRFAQTNRANTADTRADRVSQLHGHIGRLNITHNQIKDRITGLYGTEQELHGVPKPLVKESIKQLKWKDIEGRVLSRPGKPYKPDNQLGIGGRTYRIAILRIKDRKVKQNIDQLMGINFMG